MIRCWVFDATALDAALTEWLAGEDVIPACAKETVIRSFLESKAARKHKLLFDAKTALEAGTRDAQAVTPGVPKP